MANTHRPDPARLLAHMRTLSQTIGYRYSGTAGEQGAADYIEREFRSLRLANIRQHRFEFPNWDYARCDLRIRSTGRQRRITTAMPVCYSESTPPHGVTGDLVYLQTGSELDFRQNLFGKIGLLIGSASLGNSQVSRRLLDSGLLALITVDARVPYGWRTTAGAAPQWMEAYTLPTVNVPFLEAERIVRGMPARATLTITARTFPAMSQNVIGEIVGRQRPEEVIVVSGHHDAVMGAKGADDNASGVAFVLELARLFSRKQSRRTIRFISYGVEEKLSVGAYLYMRSLSPAEQRRCVFALNADTIASAVGVDTVFVTGSPALERLARRVWTRRSHPAEIVRTVDPYSDHFPLNICGVPAIWLSRPSIPPAGYWYLHSIHDNLDRIDPAVIARTVASSAELLDLTVNASRLPFPRRIAPAVMIQVRKVARQTYRHPWVVMRTMKKLERRMKHH